MTGRSGADFSVLVPKLEGALRRALRVQLTRAPELAITAPRFGGAPYRESEAWPSCTACRKPFTFLGQIDARPALAFDPGFALATLYYCRGCSVRSSKANGHGFYVDRFAAPAPALHVPLSPKDADTFGVARHPSCGVDLDGFRSFPHWEDWDEWGLDALSSRTLGKPDDAFVRAFRAWLRPLVVTRFGSSSDASTLFSYLGGHPYWANGNVEHVAMGGVTCACGARVVQLLQLDSEDAPEFTFGKGAGLLNFFFCPGSLDPARAHAPGGVDAFRFVHQMI